MTKKRGIRVTDEKRRIDMRREKKGRGIKVEEGEGEHRKEKRVEGGRRENRFAFFDIQEALLETPHRSSSLSNVLKMCCRDLIPSSPAKCGRIRTNLSRGTSLPKKKNFN